VSAETLTVAPQGEGPARTWWLSGPLVRQTMPAARKELLRLVRRAPAGPLRLDLAAVTRVDSAGVGLFRVLLTAAARRGVALQVTRFSAAAEATFKAAREAPAPAVSEARRSLLVRAGEDTMARWRGVVGFLYLVADTVVLSFGGARRTRRVRRGAVAVEGVRLGVDALPIVGLIVFLIGLVLALQSAYQLRRFGASIYMADLLAISLTREMGPLMTAIIVAGRSGASIAAEIATMQVSEEIDALRTMGLNPVRYVVVPKFQAITVTVPALTIYANVLGIFGGLVVAVLYLDIGATAFLGQVFDALVVKDVVTGLVKSLAFAWIIVLIAAHRGFAARGGAESVGLVTTASVVSSIFWVIVADAGFSLLFYFGG
jgi:phospholipid/cholesterol/gamma-HCH transport system permease protein